MTPDPSLNKLECPQCFFYQNYRGEVAEHCISPISVRYGSTECRPEPHWLLLAHDFQRSAETEFAVSQFISVGGMDAYRALSDFIAELEAQIAASHNTALRELLTSVPMHSASDGEWRRRILAPLNPQEDQTDA